MELCHRSFAAISSSLTYAGGVGTVADVGTDRDEALVDALRLREPTAAERLVARYGDRAYRLAFRITGNHEDGHHADPISDWSTRLDDPAMQRELRDILASTLEELPPHYRAVIVLRDV